MEAMKVTKDPCQSHGGARAQNTKDPVCGMEVGQDSAFGKLDHDGQTYYFCSAHCRDRFKSDPGKYVGASRK